MNDRREFLRPEWMTDEQADAMARLVHAALSEVGYPTRFAPSDSPRRYVEFSDLRYGNDEHRAVLTKARHLAVMSLGWDLADFYEDEGAA